MGKKINPIFFRLGKYSNYHSFWYIDKKKYSIFLKKEILIREILKKNFFFVDVNYIDIIFSNNIVFNFYLINFNSINNIEKYLDFFIFQISKIFKKNIILYFINDIDNINAKYIAISLLNQIDNKNLIKKVVKKECFKYINKLNGCKIKISGRIDGVDIARKEWFLFGKIPLHTIKSNIDYYFCEIITQYGVLGIKVWIFKNNYEK